MSRNRSWTRCDCDRKLGPSDVPWDDPTLLTIQQYFEAIGWDINDDNSGHGWGYGYRDDLEKSRIAWHSRDGSRVSNFRYAHDDTMVQTECVAIQPWLRYKFKRIECDCKRVYVGWYVAHPFPSGGKAVYELYDSSFWSTFNDEPGDDDQPAFHEPDWDKDAEEMLQLPLPWNED